MTKLNINQSDEANARLIYAAISAKCSDDGQVKSVCHSWLMAVVLSLNSLAAFMTIKFGQVIRSCAFNRLYTLASETK